MPEETLLSVEQPRTRAEIAAQLRSLADGFDGGGSLTIATDDQTVTVTPPERPKFEFEVEHEYDEDAADSQRSNEISIEVEIEWDETDVDADADAAVDVDSDTDIDPSNDAERTTAADDTDIVEEDTELAAPIEPDGEPVPTAATGDAETVVSQGQFQLYVDRAGKWRWRLVHRNGNIIAASGQGYASRQKAQQGMASVMRNAPDAKAITVE